MLHLEFPNYSKMIIHPRNKNLGVRGGGSSFASAASKQMDSWSMEDRAKVKNMLLSDPLEQLSPADLKMLWNLRYLCITQPAALPKVLLAVDWTDSEAVREAHHLLDEWAPLTPIQALMLLDAHFPDERVRAYAVDRLKALTDDELGDYIIQLVQVLKYEQYHDSPLAVYLMARALRCRNSIGHQMFWHLKAEMHVPEISERYGFMLEVYLEYCGAHLTDLQNQNSVMKGFIDCARCIKPEFNPLIDKKSRLPTLR
eukprot:SAG22_NODE_17_length_32684_cov_34.234095_21_plen_256_part_00